MGKLTFPLAFPRTSLFLVILLLCSVSALSRLGEPESISPQVDDDEVVAPEEGLDSLDNGRFSSRKSKLFPYFLLQFPNDFCNSPGGSGVCVSAKECRQRGGTTVGTCAQGFGACCRYVKSCGSEPADVQVRENSTELQSSEGTCRFVLPRARGICQVRLDFEAFQFGSGLPTGECSATKISVEGAVNLDIGGLDLCGSLTGQHLYLTYGAAENLYISTSEVLANSDDKYSIRVSYLRCDSRQSVPAYCTQYYSGNTGEVRSFNHPNQHLNNQEYTICVADPRDNGLGKLRNSRQTVSPKIRWEKCGDEQENFFISGVAADPPVADPSQCLTDYIQIFGGNRKCGNQFEEETVSAPYLLQVTFDSMETDVVFGLPKLMINRPNEMSCELLNTIGTKCRNVTDSDMCACSRHVETRAVDEGNTGFCLTYKIIT